LPTLLEALGRLTERPWRLLIAGPRRLPYWRGRARAAGLGSSRLSMFRDLDSATLLAASDVLAHPTWRDPFPLVVLESLASGTPVITTREAGAAHLIEEGVSGRVLDRPGDVQALTAALAETLDRLARAPFDREAVRASALGHDASTWLERLESIVLDA
jgi:glycosyltransferase involved in cell wall biosynthesis